MATSNGVTIKVVYDSEAAPDFCHACGFSCLVELKLKDEKILFDAGWDGVKLLSNMKSLGESPRDIDRVVLSHLNWDHIGGINHLRESGKEIWVPDSFSRNFKKELAQRFDLHEVNTPVEIGDGVYSTGELGGRLKEQSLSSNPRRDHLF